MGETKDIEDLILGRLPETAMAPASVPWRFEKFDGVAGGILKQDLLAAPAADDVIAEVRPRIAHALDLAGEVGDFELDAVPASRLGLASVGPVLLPRLPVCLTRGVDRPARGSRSRGRGAAQR